MKETKHLSTSEKHGIDLVSQTDLNILSIGISTAGVAEIEMARKNPSSHIVATTIDLQGLEFTKKMIEKENLQNRIELKIEDVSEKLPYENNYFDFIYARLVLHYLDNQKLENALAELYRVLKTDGKFFIVVRSFDWESELEGTTFDEKTGMTRHPDIKTVGTNDVKYIERRLHSVESIQEFLQKAGFKINAIKEYREYLARDYERMDKNEKPSKVIEICVNK